MISKVKVKNHQIITTMTQQQLIDELLKMNPLLTIHGAISIIKATEK